MRRAAGRRSSSIGTRAGRALGFCSSALAGGAALLAIWQLDSFHALLGHGAAPASAPPTPAIYRPAGERGGCTQAPIDRASGQTTPADCHTMAPGDGIARA
jgi:hypothetical protein